jgi:cytochrome P450
MWLQRFVTRFQRPPRPETAQDMSWLQRIPAGSQPADQSSIFGSHIATNKAECPFRFLARPEVPDTVRLDHGVMSGSTPDAVYTKDPVIARKILQNKAHPKTRAWYRFHHRIFAYRVPRDLLTYSNADDPMVGKLRKAYVSGLAEAFEQHHDEIVACIDRWVDDVARGTVEMTRATRRLNADIVHLIAYGERPRNGLNAFIYQDVSAMLRDPKRRLAHLIWPTLDRLPTPYALFNRLRAEIFRWTTTLYFNRYKDEPKALLGRLHRQGLAEGNPDFAWQTLPFLINAGNAIVPHPMVMALRLLADNPELQQRVVDEGLYAAVLKETLRLYPPVTTMARVVKEQVRGESAVLEPMASPEGQLYINPTGILHHPRGWSRPEEFVIDRWLPGWTDDADPEYRLYIPFGLGARSCVGAAYATKLLEIYLERVLSKRVVSSTSNERPRIEEGSIVFVRYPLKLTFTDRVASPAG